MSKWELVGGPTHRSRTNYAWVGDVGEWLLVWGSSRSQIWPTASSSETPDIMNCFRTPTIFSVSKKANVVQGCSGAGVSISTCRNRLDWLNQKRLSLMLACNVPSTQDSAASYLYSSVHCEFGFGEGDLGIHNLYPLVMTNIAIEHGHL